MVATCAVIKKEAAGIIAGYYQLFCLELSEWHSSLFTSSAVNPTNYSYKHIVSLTNDLSLFRVRDTPTCGTCSLIGSFCLHTPYILYTPSLLPRHLSFAHPLPMPPLLLSSFTSPLPSSQSLLSTPLSSFLCTPFPPCLPSSSPLSPPLLLLHPSLSSLLPRHLSFAHPFPMSPLLLSSFTSSPPPSPQSLIDELSVSSNIDLPKAMLEGLLQTVVCRDVVGWRKRARRLVLVLTDADYHLAGDGKV